VADVVGDFQIPHGIGSGDPQAILHPFNADNGCCQGRGQPLGRHRINGAAQGDVAAFTVDLQAAVI